MKTPQEKIDTLIISDIHLGFKHSRVDLLLKILNKFSFNKLILNGDIFDDLNLKTLNRHHWHILSKIRELSHSTEIIWIAGNHDSQINILSNLIGVKFYNKYIWRHKGKKFIAIHGHQFDNFLHKNSIISSIAVSFFYLLQGLGGFSKTMAKWARSHSKRWMRLSKQVANRAIFFAKINNTDFIFCGHTHLAMFKKKWGIKYYNSGSFAESPSSYITIVDSKIKIFNIS